MTTFLSNRSIYSSVVCGIVPQARERRLLPRLWPLSLLLPLRVSRLLAKVDAGEEEENGSVQ